MKLLTRTLTGPATLLALFAFSPAVADYAPRGDMNDLMLIYIAEGRWHEEQFAPYVTYLAGEDGGTPVDWFYDSFLFMQYGDGPSGESYMTGKTNRADWESFHDLLFEPGSHLHALDRAISQAADVLDEPDRRTPVAVMVSYPHPEQTDFGDVDGDGITEDLSVVAARDKVIAWAIGDVATRFEAADFRHLELRGFYWMIEWVAPGDGEEIIKRVGRIVHDAGYEFLWIPCFGAWQAAGRSAELGFDISYLQPNYAFMRQHGQEYDEQRLCRTAQIGLDSGLGIEIEMHPALLEEPDRRRHLLDYLHHGAEGRDGYMAGAPHAYYQGYQTIGEFQRSQDPDLRGLYDALYEFARGRLRPDAAASPYLPVEADQGLESLTDGRYLEATSGPVAGVAVAERRFFDFVLDDLRPVAGLRLHYQLTGTDTAAPSWMQAWTCGSAQGGDWQPVYSPSPARQEPPGDASGRLAGALTTDFTSVEARRLRVEVWPPEGRRAVLDEVSVLPGRDGPTNLALDRPYTVEPGWPGTYPDDGKKLTDGTRTAHGFGDGVSVGWYNSDPLVTLDLGREVEVDEVRIGAQGGGGAAVWFPHHTTVLASDDGVSWAPVGSLEADPDEPDDEALLSTLSIPLTDARGRYVRLLLRSHGWTMLDEIEVISAGRNVAAGRSYTVLPPPTSEEDYADTTGRTLTDGHVGSTTFGAGKTVGWSRAGPAVTIDLGRAVEASLLRAHVLGGGLWGVWFPERITVSTSSDGDTWHPAGETTDHPAEPDEPPERPAVASIDIPLDSPPFRYIRAMFTPKGWLMLGEIEVHP